MSTPKNRDVKALWDKLLEGEPPVDESVEITSSDVNQQTAQNMSIRDMVGTLGDDWTGGLSTVDFVRQQRER